MSGLVLIVLLGFSAFAVDVGNWYLTGQRVQRAADAAALAGVTQLPGDRTGAYAMARQYSGANGFTNGVQGAVVSPSLAGGSTRLRVDVNATVKNIFGGFLGQPTTTVSRHAIAEYAGPVPLGSPCNRFGDDPEPAGTASSNCSGTGNFFAMVGNRGALKANGDAFQNDSCQSSVDNCVGSTNTDYDEDGYVYTITLDRAVNNLTIQAFDPAHIVTGGTCANDSVNRLYYASRIPDRYTISDDGSTRYQTGAGDWCTGDSMFTGSTPQTTQFTVRAPSSSAWDPLAGASTPGCTKTFDGFRGDLSEALDSRTNTYRYYRPDVAQNFRQWVTLCRYNGTVPAGTYSVQVKSNGLGTDYADGHNRFSLRAFGSSSSDKDHISVAGFNKMALYANTPGGTSTFYLARIPSNSSGQYFNVNLFDVGDGANGFSYMRVLPPSETGGSFNGCTGKGVTNGGLSSCVVYLTNPSAFNGRWQTITVPIPASYSCNDSSTTGCWVRLQFYYGSGSNPTDTTSWTATLDGDPIRLVE